MLPFQIDMTYSQVKKDKRDRILAKPNSAPVGLNQALIRQISGIKGEPKWMLDFRLEAYKTFLKQKNPTWGGDLSGIDYDKIRYYLNPGSNEKLNWSEVPQEIKETFEKLGIPQAEREFLAGVKAQYDSEVVYSSLREELEEEGVIFLSMDEGLKRYPEKVKDYFGKLVPSADNKFAALNSAVWSGGSFVYIPKNSHIKRPLQAYFRINAVSMGQFERTLIVADEGSYVHYVEGCTAPTYSESALHAGVVEIFVKKGARVRYTTIQNWSTNVYNLVTKRARVEENGVMEWVDGNFGSGLTMKYPSCYLVGKSARGETLSIAFAQENQTQDTGSKMMHLAPNTSSNVISKSISMQGGKTNYRGLVYVASGADNCKSHVECHSLILDKKSLAGTLPQMDIRNSTAEATHEASVSKLEDEKLFYLRSRGLTEAEARSLIVSGFIEPVVKELPMEYAVELNRLLEFEMEKAVC